MGELGSLIKLSYNTLLLALCCIFFSKPFQLFYLFCDAEATEQKKKGGLGLVHAMQSNGNGPHSQVIDMGIWLSFFLCRFIIREGLAYNSRRYNFSTYSQGYSSPYK